MTPRQMAQGIDRRYQRDHCQQLRAFAQFCLNSGLCCTRKWNLPAGKHEYGRMAPEGTSKNLRALDA